MRDDVRPRPLRDLAASNSLRPHSLNAAHPRERGQVMVNLCLFSGSTKMLFFLLLLLFRFPFGGLDCRRTALTQFVGTSSLIRRASPPAPLPGSSVILGVICPPPACVSSLYIFSISGVVFVCVCRVSGGFLCFWRRR